MKRITARTLSAVLVFTMLISVTGVSGCGKKQEGTVSDLPDEITSDMPWYDATSTVVDTGINIADYEYTTTDVIGTVGDKIVFETYGQLLSPPFSYVSDLETHIVHIYDTSGEHLYDFDAKQAVFDYDPEITGLFVNDVTVRGDLLRIEVMNVVTVSSPYSYGQYYMYYDVEEGRIVSSEEKVLAGENANYTTELDHYEFDGWNIDEYVISLPDGTRPQYEVHLTSPDGDTTDINMPESLPTISVAGILGLMYLGEGRFVFKAVNYAFEDRFIYIDGTTSEVADLSTVNELAWLTEIEDLASYSYYDGFGNATLDPDGIKVIDLESHEIEEYLNFDNVDINRYEASFLNVISATDDKIILGGLVYREQLCDANQGAENEVKYPTLTILERADINPHAGKKVISLGYLDSISYPVAEGIRIYNETSTDTFIMIDRRYRYDVVAREVPYEADMDPKDYELTVRSTMINRLSIDMFAGEGPDIIMGAISCRQLDSPEVLLDLSDDVDIPNVYSNVMEYSKTDGALYQAPLSFSLEGIIVNSEDVPEGEIGFDYASYNEYVSGPCNGRDPNRMTRLEFMCMCLSEMSETLEVDGTYNYNSAEFVSVAEFVDSQILPDELEPEVLQEYWRPGMEDPYADDHVIIGSGLGLLAMTQGQLGDRVVMGFPSDRPRGLMIDVEQSVAVSASTEYPDQCRSFVALMVSDEIQTMFATYSGISVNRAAEEEACIEFAGRHNDRFNALSEYYTVQNLVDFEYPLCETDADELAEAINGYVENAAGLRMSDAAVEIIVREEMQPYFAGQKSIEECMEIIENRVDLYVNERG